jgi:hypothetical protein
MRETVRMAAAALLASGLLVTSAQAALPPAVQDGGHAFRQVGSGELRYLGFAIYDASLWSPGGQFSGFVPGEPVALSLWYKRGFSREDLLEITARAWKKLDTGTQAQRDRWLLALGSIWTDVEPGDNMTTVVVPGSETRFYDQTGLKGRITDPAFGPAFLGIWLDQQSVVGDLRTELLGIE